MSQIDKNHHLAIVFCIVVEKNAETYSTVVVTDRLFNNWDIDVEVLLGIAKENAIRLFPADIQSLESVVKCFIAESNQNVSEGDLEAFDVFIGFDGGFSAAACCNHCLAVMGIGAVACGEDTGED